MCFYLFQATQVPTAPHFTTELTETGCRLRRHLWNGHGAPLVGLRSESRQHSLVDRVMYCFPVILSLGFPAQPTLEPAVITALNPKREASQTLHLNSGDKGFHTKLCTVQAADGRASSRPGSAASASSKPSAGAQEAAGSGCSSSCLCLYPPLPAANGKHSTEGRDKGKTMGNTAF